LLRLRRLLVLGVVVSLAVLPLALARLAGLELQAAATGLRSGVDTVGWVFVPQLGLAVALLGLALARLGLLAAGRRLPPPPAWTSPAVESALLLGMLGTVSGMVSGFAGLSPETLEPGPLVHSLGQALRSTGVGFGIALVGVWISTPVEAHPA
jgi:hypothetical protein